MTQDCQQFRLTFTAQRVKPPSRPYHYYWFIACLLQDTAKWRWGVL